MLHYWTRGPRLLTNSVLMKTNVLAGRSEGTHGDVVQLPLSVRFERCARPVCQAADSLECVVMSGLLSERPKSALAKDSASVL